MSGRQFFLRLIIFLGLFIALDLAIGKVYNTLFNSIKSGTLFTSRYGWRESKDQILILGGSEVSHSFISKMITDSIDMTCYNLGMDGYNVYYNYALLNEILKRNKPECIIVSTMIVNENPSSVVGLFPYYKYSQTAKKVIFDVDKKLKYLCMMNSYLYNSQIIKLIQGIIIKEPETNGYKPLYSNNKFLKLDSIKTGYESSAKTLEYFRNTLNEAKLSCVKTIVMDVPRFQMGGDLIERQALKEIATSENAIYLSYMDDTTYINNPNYFKDRTHLNDDGAQVFTNSVIDTLKKYLKNGY